VRQGALRRDSQPSMNPAILEGIDFFCVAHAACVKEARHFGVRSHSSECFPSQCRCMQCGALRTGKNLLPGDAHLQHYMFCCFCCQQSILAFSRLFYKQSGATHQSTNGYQGVSCHAVQHGILMHGHNSQQITNAQQGYGHKDRCTEHQCNGLRAFFFNRGLSVFLPLPLPAHLPCSS
jgi:hypothetical protein